MRSGDTRRRLRRSCLPVMFTLAVAAALPILQPSLGAYKGLGASDGPCECVWSTPVNLGPIINTTFNEKDPALSKDGLTLYFSSNRPGGAGGTDIWMAHRLTEDGPWDQPVNLTPLNSTDEEGAPALSRDEHWMFFQSTRPGGLGGTDVWVSWRQHTQDDFGWETPVNLGSVVNFEYEDQGPFYLEGDEGAPAELYFSNNRRLAVGFMDIVLSQALPDGTFGAPQIVPELCTQYNEYGPALTHDGLEIFFMSNRPGGLGQADIWASARQSRYEPWAPPTAIVVLNSSFQEGMPTISADGAALIFQSQRPGGIGGADLWMATRTRVKVER